MPNASPLDNWLMVVQVLQGLGTGIGKSDLENLGQAGLLMKVLLRRNFDVMFVTKNHLYQLIEEDCNLKFD